MIWQRLKNLWILSNLEFLSTKQKSGLGFPILGKIKDKPKMAVIIKRKTEKDIINEVLNEN